MLILATCATYRLATDFAWEGGPFDLYAKTRGRIIARYGADDWRSEGASCPICLSFWLALPFALVVAPWDSTLVLYWLGMAGVAAFLARIGATQ